MDFIEVEPSDAERSEWPTQTKAYVESLENALSREFLIWSEEHGAWWGENRMGYTKSIARAGHYSRDEANAIVASANYGVAFNEIAIPVPPDLADKMALQKRGR